MARKLPPLNHLRAFECAARHMSFTLAAVELNVTPAAVSQQVKNLENHLGRPLFTRLTRKLVLTEAGAALLPEVSAAFDQIDAAVTTVRTRVANQRLTLRLGPSLAAKWLTPRLSGFWARHPDVDLCLFHSTAAVDFDREDIDLAITYGRGSWPGVVSEHLLSLDYFPVCSPKLVGREPATADASLLLNQTLLHDSGYADWEDWLAEAGMPQINARRGLIIDDTNVVIQAALDGQGIALGSSLFVAEHLTSGRLVAPFDTRLYPDQAFYLVCPRSHLNRPLVQEFRDWLLAEASKLEFPATLVG